MEPEPQEPRQVIAAVDVLPTNHVFRIDGSTLSYF
jgi:hypothetical protein